MKRIPLRPVLGSLLPTSRRSLSCIGARSAPAPSVVARIGRAGLVALAIDAAVGIARATTLWRRGEISVADAAKHVAREAMAGALAAAAGAAVVALSGGSATPVVGAIATIASVGTKEGIRCALD